ncbi:MAG: hypothetical protein AABX26_03130 [Nanoarchaeota archaeon]
MDTKKKVLGEFERLRDRYIPLMERRTGLNLGQIEIKSLIEENCKDDLLGRTMEIKALKRMGVVKPTVLYNPVEETIQVPTFLWNELDKSNNQEADEIMIHELTHHVWTKTPNRIPLQSVPSVVGEGFAVYGEQHWFADFLPAKRNLTPKSNYHPDYIVGEEWVRKLVEEYGDQILLKIPARYGEFVTWAEGEK